MNSTNRALNRIILMILGAALLLAGVAAVAAGSVQSAGDAWHATASRAIDWARATSDQTRITSASSVSWFALATVGALLLVVVVATAVISKLGGGRTHAVIRDDSGAGAQGPVIIEHRFISDAITHSIAARREILSCRVRAARVRGTAVMQVSVTPRQGVSPVDVAATVAALVDNLASLTGVRTPTYVFIHAGVRSRFATEHSRVAGAARLGSGRTA